MKCEFTYYSEKTKSKHTPKPLPLAFISSKFSFSTSPSKNNCDMIFIDKGNLFVVNFNIYI